MLVTPHVMVNNVVKHGCFIYLGLFYSCDGNSTHSQRRGSSVAWNPEVATQLLVASEDDGTPSLQLWDLRYSMAPVKQLLGHTKARHISDDIGVHA